MYAADSVLLAARQLLGTMMSPDIAPSEFALQSPAHPAWEGTGSDQARIAGARLDSKRRELREAHRTVADALKQSQQVLLAARQGVEAADSAWQQDKAMLASYAQTAGGYATLMKVGQRTINEVTDLINKTVGQYESLAEEVRAAAKALPNSDRPDGASQKSGSEPDQVSERSAVQMVSSETSQSGAGSSGTGPRVPPSIVGTPRPVWPNGVPKV
ncbi:hypothetical protein [Mycolicibacterium porcinum]|uniref:hypothetical protein n=1 Tax=Mycolicibacterium porcinum TaxID=39693 RepID=UPI0010428024|nr:hypothetical protein [Mycolicibacterium porcinum]